MTLARPILLYDHDCGVCSRFAHIAERTSTGWIDTVGLFTKRRTRIKSDFFNSKDRPDDNFWLLVGDVGYGGRSGLLPLAREIVRGLVI